MPSADPNLIVDALQRLLGRDPSADTLGVDAEGWVAWDEVITATRVTLSIEISADDLVGVVRRHHAFEVTRTHVRVVQHAPHVPVPDILFHATTEAGIERVRQSGVLALSGRRRLFLSEDEAAAWRAAHRLDGPPRVLVIDAHRARKAQSRFAPGHQPGLWIASPVGARHILNLRDGYGEQWSAGGIPIRRDPDGRIRMALIQVTRRSGTTWEVAKGKLEPGETPEASALREVSEEMGVNTPMAVLRHVLDVRYGFLAPGGMPRLKTIFLYLMTPLGDVTDFRPATGEGIGEVRWFTPDQACRAVTHSSLQPAMHRARLLVERFGLTPAYPPLTGS